MLPIVILNYLLLAETDRGTNRSKTLRFLKNRSLFLLDLTLKHAESRGPRFAFSPRKQKHWFKRFEKGVKASVIDNRIGEQVNDMCVVEKQTNHQRTKSKIGQFRERGGNG